VGVDYREQEDDEKKTDANHPDYALAAGGSPRLIGCLGYALIVVCHRYIEQEYSGSKLTSRVIGSDAPRLRPSRRKEYRRVTSDR
jgi:hypothetical protein